MRRLWIAIGLVLIVGASLWKFGVLPGTQKRFSADWHYNLSAVGFTGYADESGQFPAGTTLKDDSVNLTKRDIVVKQVNTDGSVELEDHYVTLDPGTNATTWEITYKAVVDPVTGKYVDSAYANDFFFFPRGAQKTTYNVRNTSYQGIPVSFVKEENISGINTFLYTFKGDLNNTAANPDVKLEPDQTITCFDFELNYWVEPTTGEIVKYREWCEGDWVVNTKTGEKLYAISRWGTDNSGDDLIRRTQEIRDILNAENLPGLYLPLLAVIAGVLALTFGLTPLIRKNQPAAAPDGLTKEAA